MQIGIVYHQHPLAFAHDLEPRRCSCYLNLVRRQIMKSPPQYMYVYFMNRFANPRIRWTAQRARLLSELAWQLLISYIIVQVMCKCNIMLIAFFSLKLCPDTVALHFQIHLVGDVFFCLFRVQFHASLEIVLTFLSGHFFQKALQRSAARGRFAKLVIQ